MPWCIFAEARGQHQWEVEWLINTNPPLLSALVKCECIIGLTSHNQEMMILMQSYGKRGKWAITGTIRGVWGGPWDSKCIGILKLWSPGGWREQRMEGGRRGAQRSVRLLSRSVQQAKGHPAGGNSLSRQTCSMDQFFPSQKLKD